MHWPQVPVWSPEWLLYYSSIQLSITGKKKKKISYMKICFEKDDMLSPKEIPDSNNGQRGWFDLYSEELGWHHLNPLINQSEFHPKQDKTLWTSWFGAIWKLPLMYSCPKNTKQNKTKQKNLNLFKSLALATSLQEM